MHDFELRANNVTALNKQIIKVALYFNLGPFFVQLKQQGWLTCINRVPTVNVFLGFECILYIQNLISRDR